MISLDNIELAGSGASVSYLRGTSMMLSVIGEDGTILNMSPQFARYLKGPNALTGDMVGANLASVLGGAYGAERVRVVRQTIASGQTTILRSVRAGRQHVSHFFPAFIDVLNVRAALALHHVVEGVVESDRFDHGRYLEASVNDYGVLSQLSRREAEVAALVATGMDAKSIATALHRSLETVGSHKKALFAKLGCQTQLQAALIIRRAGLTTRDAARIRLASKLVAA